ncbi:N-myristoyl transferase [Serendipita vermifera]|nr:N-myristoyl transferase [Serendipita vermifera]
MSARIEEVIDDDERNDQKPEDEQSDDEANQDAGGVNDENVGAGEPSSSATVSKGKKSKKKKKSKTSKTANEIPQAVVDHVVSEIRQKHGPETTESIGEEQVRMALEHLKIMEVLKGKAGIGGKNRKDMGEHKFWSTQPVPQLGEAAPQQDGPIEASKPVSEVRQAPYPLPKDFEWVTVDITDAGELKELYELLSANYVEDDDASFRFNYSAEFLKWALMPPGWHRDWLVGVRVASKKSDGDKEASKQKGRLVAFISAIPVKLRVRENIVDMSEVNFLCVHKKLRSKRLTPVLIKEVTRQCHLKGIFQAIYTAGVVIPTPISTCRYYHRLLNVPKLVDVKFTSVPRGSTMARMIRQFALPSTPRLMNPEQIAIFNNGSETTSTSSQPATWGFREMEDRDVPQVCALWERFMKRFGMVPVMNEDEIRHYLLSGRGEGPSRKCRREGQVVWSYVFEDSNTHAITDYVSFYTLPSSITQPNAKHPILDAAYLFYYATETVSGDHALRRRLTELLTDTMIVAAQAKFDVFNALTLMDNPLFMPELKFGSGDGLLNYYLYNWRTPPLAGIEPVGDQPVGRGIGVVML